jgi:hypothetical protein
VGDDFIRLVVTGHSELAIYLKKYHSLVFSTIHEGPNYVYRYDHPENEEKARGNSGMPIQGRK